MLQLIVRDVEWYQYLINAFIEIIDRAQKIILTEIIYIYNS